MNKFISSFKDAPADLKTRLFGILLFLLLLNLFVWISVFLIWPKNHMILGLVILAYGLGLRHGVDADHIAAIDNTTRKLMQAGQKPAGVGFFFSLGHSTIVIILSLLVTFFASFAKNLSYFQSMGVILGSGISAFFLLMIGVVNLIVLIDILRIWTKVAKGGKYSDLLMEEHLGRRGVLSRLLGPFLKLVKKSWNMYLIGLLFGLGFDTASEVGLLSLSAISGANNTPLAEAMLVPLSFTAGMSLIDSLDGMLMLGAYGWAYIKPVRKLYYNLNITAISVAIAFFIGGAEALQVISLQFNLKGSFFQAVKNLDFGGLGYLIIAIFVLSWLISLAVFKLKGYD